MEPFLVMQKLVFVAEGLSCSHEDEPVEEGEIALGRGSPEKGEKLVSRITADRYSLKKGAQHTQDDGYEQHPTISDFHFLKATDKQEREACELKDIDANPAGHVHQIAWEIVNQAAQQRRNDISAQRQGETSGKKFEAPMKTLHCRIVSGVGNAYAHTEHKGDSTGNRASHIRVDCAQGRLKPGGQRLIRMSPNHQDDCHGLCQVQFQLSAGVDSFTGENGIHILLRINSDIFLASA